MPRHSPGRSDRFERVYTENMALVLAYASRRCAQPGDAADVVADVFVVAWRRLDDVPEGEERLWLFGVARRVLANHRRRSRRGDALAERLRAELEARPVVQTTDESTVAVTAALAQLPATDREVLMLAAWDGLTPTEIATLEKVPAATVRSRLLRARGRLRDLLAESPAPRQRTAIVGHVSDDRRP